MLLQQHRWALGTVGTVSLLLSYLFSLARPMSNFNITYGRRLATSIVTGDKDPVLLVLRSSTAPHNVSVISLGIYYSV